MGKPNKHAELRLLMNSRHPIITVETPKEERLALRAQKKWNRYGNGSRRELHRRIDAALRAVRRQRCSDWRFGQNYDKTCPTLP